jgi:hypothetical protein
MGSGFHDFAPAEVLTAANVDGYLMRQTLMTFASEAARNSALSGVLDEGMITYQEDSNRITYYTGAAWVILSEPAQSWAGFAGTQGVSLTFSATSGWYQRKNGAFTAQMTATLSNSGTAANTIVATLPITLSTTEAVGGSALIYDASVTTMYQAYVTPSSTTTVVFSQAGATAATGVGNNPAVQLASGDIIRLTLHGLYA